MKQILRLGESYGLSHIKRYILYALFISAWITFSMDMTQAQSSKKDTSKSIQDTVFQLEEVQVSTGYQTIPKERATGSFAHIDSALFNRAVSTDVISRLKGIAPSLLFDERGGGDPVLSIRGRSTIFANAAPLIVVDNFPYEGDLKNLNPNDVADVSILRDAAAASIWGVRAGNGVIVITTKRGRKNQPLQINVNSNVAVSAKPDLYYEKKMSSSDLIDVQQFLFDQHYYDADLGNTTTYPQIPPAVEIMADASLSDAQKQQQLEALRGQDIRQDLDKYFYQHEVNQQYAFNVQGGGEKHSFYYSAGFDKTQAPEVGNGYHRISLNAQNNFILLPKLELSTGLTYTQSQNSLNNVYQTVRKTEPYNRTVDGQGNPLPIQNGFRQSFASSAEEKGLLNWEYVPLDELALADRGTGLHNTRATGSFSYTIIPGLKADVRYQFERQGSQMKELDPEESYSVRDRINRFSVISSKGVRQNFPPGAVLIYQNADLQSQNGRAQLSYDRLFKSHEIHVTGGFEARQIRTEGYSRNYYGYDVLTGIGSSFNPDSLYLQYPAGGRARISLPNTTSATVDRFRSWFFNGAYTYLGRYTLSASGRIDQSNLFGVKTNQRQVPLWSAGLKWDINKETFYQIKALPLLQLRATYGYNGNFDNSLTAYTTARYYGSGALTGLPGADIVNPPNPSLRWEKNAVLNLGLDFVVKGTVLSGKIDFYSRRGKDLIGDGPLDPTSGLTSFRGNLADMSGHGWDVELNGHNLKTGDFQWSSQLLFSYSVDKVTKYDETNQPVTMFFGESLLDGIIPPREGQPLFGMYSYRWAGLDPQTGASRGYLNGQPSTDIAAITKVLTFDSLSYQGRGVPPVYGSLRNTFTYKQFDLSFNITYKFGYYFRRTSIQYDGLYRYGTGHADYAMRWQQPGDERHTEVPAMAYPANTSADAYYANSEALVEKGDHIRLQDIRIGYHLGRFQFYAYVENIGILWRANDQGIDPDYSVMTRASSNGTMVLPAPFSASFGWSINL